MDFSVYFYNMNSMYKKHFIRVLITFSFINFEIFFKLQKVFNAIQICHF